MTDFTLPEVSVKQTDAMKAFVNSIVPTPPAPAPAPVPPSPSPAGQKLWAVPPPRAKHIKGVTNPTYEPDTFYENCSGLAIPHGAKHITVLDCTNILGSSFLYGPQDVWIGGRPDKLMDKLGYANQDSFHIIRLYAADDPIKYPGASDLTFAFIDAHGLHRVPPTDTRVHCDVFQIISGLRLTIGGCLIRDNGGPGEGVQPLFASSEAPTAGGTPIEDLLIEDNKFVNNAHNASVFLAKVAGKSTLRGNDLGGKMLRSGLAAAPNVDFDASNKNGVWNVTDSLGHTVKTLKPGEKYVP